MRLSYLSVFFLLTFCPSLLGQVTLSAPTVQAAPNTRISIEISAKAPDSLAALQFSMAWDSSVLSFVSVDRFGLPDMSADNNFGLLRTANGLLAFLWEDKTVEGYPIKNGVVLFRITFNVIGKNGTKSMLQFINTPTRIKAHNPQVLPIQIETKDGMVNIGTTAVGEISDTEGGAILFQNTPNPARSFTMIPFSIKESDTVALRIYDINGRQVVEKKSFFPAGKHEIRFDTEGGLSRGTYIYSIITSKTQLSRTMIVD